MEGAPSLGPVLGWINPLYLQPGYPERKLGHLVPTLKESSSQAVLPPHRKHRKAPLILGNQLVVPRSGLLPVDLGTDREISGRDLGFRWNRAVTPVQG